MTITTIEELEAQFEELKLIGQEGASYPNEMDSHDLAAIATILNFIAAELALLIRLNLIVMKAREDS